jgi:hypothetical protein
MLSNSTKNKKSASSLNYRDIFYTIFDEFILHSGVQPRRLYDFQSLNREIRLFLAVLKYI